MPTFQSSDGTAALLAENTGGGFGVVGVSDAGKAVEGRTDTGTAIVGTAVTGTGVIGISESFGVVGVSDTGKAVEGRTDTGTAIVGTASDPSGRAAFFDGIVEVTRDLILTGGDVAEQFDVVERQDVGAFSITPGAVVVLEDNGALAVCTQAYDRCVAGVVSGAGDRVPALILDRQAAHGGRRRSSIAVVGKVWCHADASLMPIRTGDMLTTSPNPGHAMAATDRRAAFGAVLGKALTSLSSGTGLVLVLVGLA